MKYIIALEGVHGAGKTTMLMTFKQPTKSNTIPIVAENFLDNDKIMGLNKTGILSESLWISDWFSNVLKHFNEGHDVVITDRSPYSACIYSGSPLLKELVDKQFEELEQVSVKLTTVYLKVPIDVIWSRIMKRLSSGQETTERLELNENDYEFLKTIYKVYEGCSWDWFVTNLEEFDKVVSEYL